MTTVGAPGTRRAVAAANALVAGDKGLLAIDESIPTCNKRFARLGIAQTEHNRRACRELIVTTPGLTESITGVILCNETIRQHTTAGEAFATVLVNAGIVPGIKVDLGAKPLAAHPGEKVTEGLDGLRERLAEPFGGPDGHSARDQILLTVASSNTNAIDIASLDCAGRMKASAKCQVNT